MSPPESSGAARAIGVARSRQESRPVLARRVKAAAWRRPFSFRRSLAMQRRYPSVRREQRVDRDRRRVRVDRKYNALLPSLTRAPNDFLHEAVGKPFQRFRSGSPKSADASVFFFGFVGFAACFSVLKFVHAVAIRAARRSRRRAPRAERRSRRRFLVSGCRRHRCLLDIRRSLSRRPRCRPPPAFRFSESRSCGPGAVRRAAFAREASGQNTVFFAVVLR